jgi:hypothetical protein
MLINQRWTALLCQVPPFRSCFVRSRACRLVVCDYYTRRVFSVCRLTFIASSASRRRALCATKHNVSLVCVCSLFKLLSVRSGAASGALLGPLFQTTPQTRAPRQDHPRNTQLIPPKTSCPSTIVPACRPMSYHTGSSFTRGATRLALARSTKSPSAAGDSPVGMNMPAVVCDHGPVCVARFSVPLVDVDNGGAALPEAVHEYTLSNLPG